MKDRTIRLHMFCSVKGGVGKSSLAITTAKLLAATGRGIALVDCDLSGTSLADGLRLCAPDVTLDEEGAVELRAEPTGKFHNVEETRRRRSKRRTALQSGEDWLARMHPPPYLNDALNFAYGMMVEPIDMDERRARMDTLHWRHEHDDGILYFPSSSLYDDVKPTMEWFLDKPFDFAYALSVCLDGLAKRVPTLTDMVLDLPPGIWGFPHEALVIAHLLQTKKPFAPTFPQWHKGDTEWQARVFMVTSQDPNDYIPALEYIALHDEKLPDLWPLVNRSNQDIREIKDEARRRLEPVVAESDLMERIRGIGIIPALTKLFRNGDLNLKDISPETAESLRLILQLKEAS